MAFLTPGQTLANVQKKVVGPVKPPVTGVPAAGTVHQSIGLPTTTPTTPVTAGGAAGAIPTSTQAQSTPTPTPSTPSASDLINSAYAANYASQLEALQRARDVQLQGLNGQATAAKQNGYDNRNANDVMAAQQMNALKESMASQGINGGDSITAQIGNQTSRQNGANAINRDQANALQNIEQQRALINSNEANDETALMQQLQGIRDSALANQSNADRSYNLDQSQVTGFLNTPEMQNQYDAVAQAKQDYANATTPEARLAAHQKAEDARAILTKLGANAGVVGSDVTLGQAQGNKGQYGIETMAHQQLMNDEKQQKILNDANLAGTYNGKQTLDAQNQSFNQGVTIAGLTGHMPDGTATTAEQQRILGNLWQQADMTGVIPDQLATIYKIPKGTPTQAAKQWAASFNQSALESDRNYGLQQDQFQSGVDQDIFKMLQGDTTKPAAGPTVSDISKVINSSPLVKKDPAGNPVNITDPNVRNQIESMIITQTQDPVTAVQLYNMYGIPVPAALTKEYQAALAGK